jgi:chlorite dismutase
MSERLFSFIGESAGPWRIDRIETIVGEGLGKAERLNVVRGSFEGLSEWTLRGITSHDRYVGRQEKEELLARQPELGRSQAICAALIPIRKNEAWWKLAQDERRAIFEERSGHIRTGIAHLPAIARRLYHCRDVGETEPFDFLTWFEFAPADRPSFDRLVAELRKSEEWKYVDREVDVRLTLDPASG